MVYNPTARNISHYGGELATDGSIEVQIRKSIRPRCDTIVSTSDSAGAKSMRDALQRMKVEVNSATRTGQDPVVTNFETFESKRRGVLLFLDQQIARLEPLIRVN